jgi:hypothetical protein
MTPAIIKTIGLTPAQEQLLASRAVVVTGHARDAGPLPPWLRVIPPAAPAVQAAARPASAAAPAPVAAAPQDYSLMTTENLWQVHATITDGAKATAFFRAHIKPRMVS